MGRPEARLALRDAKRHSWDHEDTKRTKKHEEVFFLDLRVLRDLVFS